MSWLYRQYAHDVQFSRLKYCRSKPVHIDLIDAQAKATPSVKLVVTPHALTVDHSESRLIEAMKATIVQEKHPPKAQY